MIEAARMLVSRRSRRLARTVQGADIKINVGATRDPYSGWHRLPASQGNGEKLLLGETGNDSS